MSVTTELGRNSASSARSSQPPVADPKPPGRHGQDALDHGRVQSAQIAAKPLAIGRADNGHGQCLLCGDRNPDSLGLSFRANEAGIISARVRAHPGLQGYDGILHGGVIGALLDEAMTHCLFHHGVKAVTGELWVRFLKPVPCQADLDLKAWLSSQRPPLYRVKAELVYEQQVVARAEAKFMPCPGSR